VVHEAYFVPESTPLQTQLLNFQRHSRRIGVVVDEYGDVEGIVTLEDILEEIVGEMSNDEDELSQEILTEILESIPDANVCLEVSGYRMETLQICDNLVRTVRITKTARAPENL